MRLWLINPFEPLPVDGFPVMRYRQLARELGARGHEVTWWSTDFFHLLKRRRAGAQSPTTDDPYEIRSLSPLRYRRNRSLRRLLSHGVLAIQAWRELSLSAPPDLLLSSWVPLELSAAAAQWSRASRVPLCLDILDPWPDSFAALLPGALRPLAPALLWPHRRMGRQALRTATGVSAVSNTFLAWALRLMDVPTPPPSAIFYPAASLQELPPRDPPRRPLKVIFSGTIGRMYDFDLMIGAAELLQRTHPGEVELRIAGAGPRLEELRDRPPPANVQLVGHQRAQEVARLLATSDVGLCCFPMDASATLTSKLFHYLSFGLPVVGTPQREMAAFLEEQEVGLTASTAEQLANALVRFLHDEKLWLRMSEAARALSCQHSLESEMRRMADFLVSLPASSPDHRVQGRTIQ